MWTFRNMWRFLENTSLLIHGIVKALKNPHRLITRDNPASHSMRKSQSKQGIRKKLERKSTVMNIVRVTDADGQLMPEIFEYLVEAILPMLKVKEMTLYIHMYICTFAFVFPYNFCYTYMCRVILLCITIHVCTTGRFDRIKC